MQNDNIATCIRIRDPFAGARYWLRTDRYTFKSVESENTKSKGRARPSLPLLFSSFPSSSLSLSLPSLPRLPLRLPSPYPSCKDDSAVSQRPAVFSELPFNASPRRKGGRRRTKEADARGEREKEGEKRPTGTRTRSEGRKGVWSMLAKIGF